MFDFLIVGAGFAGSVLAERIADVLNKKVLIVEKRNHIGGNAYDYYNEDGILVHKYGPHWFHTNNDNIVKYLSVFTDWIRKDHKIRVNINGKLVPLPINIETVNILYDFNFTEPEELEAYFNKVRIPIKNPQNAEEQVISQVGLDLYEKIYKKYTTKQWNIDPKKLLPEVTGRIPVRYNNDDRYFNDKYQLMPKYGYTRMFNKMLKHRNISLLLNTRYQDIINYISFKKLIYTGPIDEFFDYKYGKLPYRSVRFEHETIKREFYQDFQQINFPNHYPYTRIIEWKHATEQKHCFTTITKEFPCDPEEVENEKYYPVLMKESISNYKKYEKDAQKLRTTYFCGRLAEFKYYNMDQIVERALNMFRFIAEKV